jgi:2-methylisocitrate lyase-like PEP mutase family enzyme
MQNTQKLLKLCNQRNALIVPGAPNAFFARIIEDLGFEAVYVTGAGIANMQLGMPDLGLTTISEISNTVANIADVVDLPIIVDADTGFGNALNVIRTIKTLERSGASGIQLEDQVFPKKCGHFDGKKVIPTSEMVQKIHAAVDTRYDNDLQIIARTDAVVSEGLNSAIERAQSYIEAGADITFVEAPGSEEELARIANELKAPQIANIVHGGKTPDLGRAKLAEFGFSLVLYANAALQAALKASNEVLLTLKNSGNLSEVTGKLASFDERQKVVKKPEWDNLETKYIFDEESFL